MKFYNLMGACLMCCLLIVLVSCNQGVDDPEGGSKNAPSAYLPLRVGDYWDFKAVNNNLSTIVQHWEVSGTAQLNGHEYYLITKFDAGNHTPIDSMYLREANGDVYTYRRSMGFEELKYKLNANDGDTWTYPYMDGDVMNVTLHVGSLKLASKTILDCRNYYFDVERWADEEHTSTLAPNIGFIREYSDAWGSGIVLSKASIGGNVIEF
jgi:hypothetical protein